MLWCAAAVCAAGEERVDISDLVEQAVLLELRVEGADDLAHLLVNHSTRLGKGDHILIEASGVSYPGRIMDFARIDPELRPGLTLVLVDAASMPSQLNDPGLAEVIAAQMRDADLFLLTKTDIASDCEVT